MSIELKELKVGQIWVVRDQHLWCLITAVLDVMPDQVVVNCRWSYPNGGNMHANNSRSFYPYKNVYWFKPGGVVDKNFDLITCVYEGVQ